MDAAAISARLGARFPNEVGALVAFGPQAASGPQAGRGEPAIAVRPAAVVAVAAYCKSDPELAFDCLSNLSGVDYPARQQIEVVYHLFSYARRHALVLKVGVSRDAPALATVSGIWRTAIWHEREIFDLLGVEFIGHPDLRRILLPEDWVGHPLRKDYVEPTEYHGISTKRESML